MPHDDPPESAQRPTTGFEERATVPEQPPVSEPVSSGAPTTPNVLEQRVLGLERATSLNASRLRETHDELLVELQRHRVEARWRHRKLCTLLGGLAALLLTVWLALRFAWHPLSVAGACFALAGAVLLVWQHFDTAQERAKALVLAAP